MFRHILIPTDGSALSRMAVGAGVKLAQALGARVTGLFASPAATPIVYRDALPVGYATPKRHEKMIEKTAAGYLAVIEKAAKAAGAACADCCSAARLRRCSLRPRSRWSSSVEVYDSLARPLGRENLTAVKAKLSARCRKLAKEETQ